MSPQEFLKSAPPILVEYWADGHRLARVLLPSTEERYNETSRFFACNICLDVWGWVWYPNRYWQYVYQDCQLHNSRRYAEDHIPGSMLGPGGFDLDQFPIEVLKREFDLYYNQIERKGDV